MNKAKSNKKPKEIFSGENSKEMWRYINSVSDPDTHWALYILGCRCQELEAEVRKLRRKISSSVSPTVAAKSVP